MPTLYIIATPIGNLEDISLRALRLLSDVAYVLCEDTRVTRKLLSHYKVKTQTIAYHQHTGAGRLEEILTLLAGGQDLALVSDAGTPGISDPGGKLVEAVIERFGGEVRIESVPGPSAVTAALSISGIPTDKFIFLGFPPHKKGRQKFLERIFLADYPVVVYESKHRIIKFLEELMAWNERAAKDRSGPPTLKELAGAVEEDGVEEAEAAPEAAEDLSSDGGDEEALDQDHSLQPVTSVVVCRELSKMHETTYRGEIANILARIRENKDDQKGEFVVVIGK